MESVFMFLGNISVYHHLHLALRLKKLLFWCYNCNVQKTFSDVCLGILCLSFSGLISGSMGQHLWPTVSLP
jgi:hypothetical protein